ncbi:glycoside hydrolase family 19 protein [Pigmentiphaga litoralis]|uniref:Putative chitinase n=1 Tax=Pigmentiphaga litoralis TaxID=516702 RepID=A0A7Y9J045_9BURK|nr:glycoside hydrolase family 19 protein [Pigmentiphaga litoralis]NYE26114.1 putative chitinase [Pigmentiphaga litoralis]NYE85234.1 putative chitinase [Pigmentiphaga litoralis]
MILTVQQLARATDSPIGRAAPWLSPLKAAMQAFQINTPRRGAAFLAQLTHESGRLVYVRELWGPTVAQSRYEGRADLGNTQPGDGSRYRGRALIQTTGRANYAATRDGLRKAGPATPDFVAEPARLEEREWAALSAAWFWTDYKRLNPLADTGTMADFVTITRRINGGINGLSDRQNLWKGAKAALQVPA